MEPTIIEWINLAVDGDLNAQSQLYMITKDKAYYLAMQLLRNRQEAEDVLQEAYITAFSKLSTLDNANKFQGWLDTLVINRAKDVLRRKKPIVFADMNSVDGEEYEPEVIEDRIEFQPQESMDYQETKRLIQEIIDELPEEQRIAIMLYYYKEMSVAEIASYAECSANTIKSRLSYARKTIKSKVEGLEKNGTKLYCMPVLPFLYWMLRTQANEMVCSSSNILQGIQGTSASYSTVGQVVKAASESLGNAAPGSGLQGVAAAAKVGGMSIGIKAGLAAVIATVGITGGILLYKASNPEEAKEAVATEQTVPEGTEALMEETDPVSVEPLQEETATVEEKSFEWESSWSRTDVQTSDPGGLDISNTDEEGFDFLINVSHGGNVGEVEGHATFASETEANATVATPGGEEKATFRFTVVDDRIEITSENSWVFGGMGVFFDGTYMKGEPTYTNENIVKDVLGDNLEDVKNLLGKEDYEALTFVMEEGTSYETELTYSGFIDGVGYGADLWIKEEGKIYCLLLDTYKGYRFITNDSEYSSSVPEEFGVLREGMDMAYIFKEMK